MALIGYTPGGSPIFYGPRNIGPRKKTKGDKNTRFKCTVCTARTTKNQGKRNGGVCFACKSPLKGWPK